MIDSHKLMNNYSTYVFWVTRVNNPIHDLSLVKAVFLIQPQKMQQQSDDGRHSRPVNLTSHGEAPLPPAAIGQSGRDLRGLHTENPQSLPP